MLGAEQERWLIDGLSHSAGTWNIVAQQTVMAKADRDPGPGELLPNDNWNGYEPARQRLFDGVVRAPASRTWSSSPATPTAAWSPT